MASFMVFLLRKSSSYSSSYSYSNVRTTDDEYEYDDEDDPSAQTSVPGPFSLRIFYFPRRKDVNGKKAAERKPVDLGLTAHYHVRQMSSSSASIKAHSAWSTA